MHPKKYVHGPKSYRVTIYVDGKRDRQIESASNREAHGAESRFGTKVRGVLCGSASEHGEGEVSKPYRTVGDRKGPDHARHQTEKRNCTSSALLAPRTGHSDSMLLQNSFVPILGRATAATARARGIRTAQPPQHPHGSSPRSLAPRTTQPRRAPPSSSRTSCTQLSPRCSSGV